MIEMIEPVFESYPKEEDFESMMNTRFGKIEAKKRTKVLKEFLKQIKNEI